MKYWPAERCEVCATWLFQRGTPGVKLGRYQYEAERHGPVLQTFELFPEHTPARCREMKATR